MSAPQFRCRQCSRNFRNNVALYAHLLSAHQLGTGSPPGASPGPSAAGPRANRPAAVPRARNAAEREPTSQGIVAMLRPLQIAGSTGQPVVSSTIIEAREFTRLYEMTVSNPGSVFVGLYAEFHMSGVPTTTGEVLAHFAPENQAPPTITTMSLATNLVTLPATSTGKHLLHAAIPAGHAAHTERALRGGQLGLRLDIVSTSTAAFRVRFFMRVRPGPQVDALNADGATVIPPPLTVAPVFPAVVPGPGNPHIVESTNVPGLFQFPVRTGATMRVTSNGTWQLGDGAGGWTAVRGPAPALTAPGVLRTITTATTAPADWVFGG